MYQLLLVCVLGATVLPSRAQLPEQVHITYGAQPSEMVVTWVTLNATNETVVAYGTSSLDKIANGSVSKFVDGGSEHRVLYMHTVKLPGLAPATKYNYRCGGKNGWSKEFQFTTMREGSDWSPRFAVYGDLGKDNAQSLPRLLEDTKKGLYDSILHVGDFAYNMDTDNARVGDAFMRQIEDIAANLPYMTCVGNHEGAYNFSNYINRFKMSRSDGSVGGDNNMFYSFNIGPAHIIALSTEFYFFIEYGFRQIAKQFEWLEKDLQEANTPENRAKRPWIITMGHRPMYCSNDNWDDCTHRYSLIREGIPIVKLYGLEDLFYKHGVDLMIWAHEHSYERLFPVYNRKVCNGSVSEPYRNPRAPVHVITGSAGCLERHNNFEKDSPPWTAFRSTDYGYSRMTIHNSSHLYFEQLSDDQHGAIIDKMWIVKSQHGPGIYNC